MGPQAYIYLSYLWFHVPYGGPGPPDPSFRTLLLFIETITMEDVSIFCAAQAS